MLDNCSYNKVKLLHQLCSLTWFIDKYAITDAKSAGNADCVKILEDMKKDLEEHSEKLSRTMTICTCAK